MQPIEQSSLVVVKDSYERVSDQLLCEVYGEVLLIRSTDSTTICKRSAKNMIQRALVWLYFVGHARNASFIAGNIVHKGGLFQSITKKQAVELLGMWVFHKIALEMD